MGPAPLGKFENLTYFQHSGHQKEFCCPPAYFMDSDVSLRSSYTFLHTGNQSEQIILLFLQVDEDWLLPKFWENLLNTLIFRAVKKFLSSRLIMNSRMKGTSSCGTRHIGTL